MRLCFGLTFIPLLLTADLGCAGEADACVHRASCSGTGLFELGLFSAADLAPAASYASIEGCLNGTCRARVVDALPDPGEGITLGSQVVMPDPQLVIVLSRVESPDDVGISVGMAADSSLLHDGDVYNISLTAGDGRQLAARSWSATYEITMAADPRCAECTVTVAVTPL